jgi:hypothetical protein
MLVSSNGTERQEKGACLDYLDDSAAWHHDRVGLWRRRSATKRRYSGGDLHDHGQGHVRSATTLEKLFAYGAMKGTSNMNHDEALHNRVLDTTFSDDFGNQFVVHHRRTMIWIAD